MTDTVIVGIIGFVTTITGSIVSWLTSKKKYRVDIDSTEIENLKKSLEFYENIVKDNNEKLKFYINLAESNRLEIYRLKDIIHRLLNNSCLDNSCLDRKFYTEAQIGEILGKVTSNDKNS